MNRLRAVLQEMSHHLHHLDRGWALVGGMAEARRTVDLIVERGFHCGEDLRSRFEELLVLGPSNL